MIKVSIIYRGIFCPGLGTGVERFQLQAQSGRPAVQGIPRTPGFSGGSDGRGNLSIQQEFFRVYSEGVGQAYPRTLYTENSLLNDTIVELESQEYRAIAALGAVMHLSLFYRDGKVLDPREVINEIFNPANYREYSQVVQLLAREGFLCPTVSSSREDPFSQILTSYKQLSSKFRQPSAQVELAQDLHCENIIILLVINVATGAPPIEASFTSIIKPMRLSLAGGAYQARSQELMRKAAFENFIAVVNSLADYGRIATAAPRDEPALSVEALAVILMERVLEEGEEILGPRRFETLPEQVKELASAMIGHLRSGNLHEGIRAAVEIKGIVNRPLSQLS